MRLTALLVGAAFGLFCSSSVATPASAQAFFDYPDVSSVSLSPAGERIATISFREGNQRLSVTNIATGATQTLLDLAEFSEDEAVASAVEWIDETQIAVQYTEIRKGVARLVDTRLISYLLIAQLSRSPDSNARLLRVRTKGRLVNALPGEPNAFLYAKSGVTSHVYKLNTDKLSEVGARLGKLDKVDGGQFIAANRIASVKGFATRWFLNPAAEPMATLTVNPGPKIKLSELGEDGEFSVIKEWSFEKDEDEDLEREQRLIPIFMAPGKNSYYCVRLDKGRRNAVFKVNFSSGEETLIYENDSYEISGIIMSEAEDDILGVRVIRDAGLQNIYFGNVNAESATAVIEPSIDVTVDHNLTANLTLRYREAHSQPGHYVIHDEQTGSETLVGSEYPQLLDQLDSELIDGRVTVQGLEIPYLLTVPGSAHSQPHPLVVMPHGGPIGVFDDRYFDSATQFLAANGFAVLRVNYRGSSGYSVALREAGKKQWGKLMLEDIHSAVLTATSRADIDGSRVCAFGASYGGYAAMMLTIKFPDTYQCASSHAGVTDINLYVETPYASASQRKWLRDHIGNSRTEYDELKALSPVYVADQLTRPVYVSHGAEDDVVDVEHAYRLHMALNKFGKTHVFKIYEEQGHGFEDADQRREFYNQLSRFLNEHIGR